MLISVKLVLSQTPANTARPCTLANALLGVPVYAPHLLGTHCTYPRMDGSVT